jgi:TPR repeat protein
VNVVADRLVARPALRAGLPILFIAPLWLLSFSTRVAASPALHASFWVASALLAAWYVAVLIAARAGRIALDCDVQVVRSHWVQACVHTSIYLRWSFFWPFIAGQVLLIAGQILFAYAFTALLAWSTGKRWRIGFGPLPIILSTNLFLCFRDHWFGLQFAMIALMFLGKDYLQWTKDGRRTHIFNPSAFALFVTSIVLLASRLTAITWGQDIAVDLEWPPYMFIYLFLLGLIVQYLFNVTLVTLSAAAALYLLNITYTAFTGVYWFLDAGIPIAVFLGLHLLVTDPATSPRTYLGRVIFGALYGVGVFAAYGLLERAGMPRFYDKLLCVPFLNLGVQAFDRLARQPRWAGLPAVRRFGRLTPRRQNLIHMGIWVAFFIWMYASDFLGPGHPGHATSFWEQACDRGLRNACRDLTAIHNDECQDGDARTCVFLSDGLRSGSLKSDEPLLAMVSAGRACDLDAIGGCERLAAALRAGGTAPLETACRARDGQSCYTLGLAHLMGLGVASDPGAAFRYYDQACATHSRRACSVVGDIYRYGVGTAKDPTRAVAAYEQACDRSFLPACVSLADLVASGDGTPKNEHRARGLYRQACQMGEKSACGR